MEKLKLILSIEFIEKWQTLIGSLLGTFIAITFSVLGFVVKNFLQERSNKIRARKEAIRLAEIALSQTLNQLSFTVTQLEDFADRAKAILKEISTMTDSNHYAIHETNFPAIASIYFDAELTKMRLGSYYMHNKILITEQFIRLLNSNITKLEHDFERLLNKSERMATPEGMRPTDQRKFFIESLSSFVNMIETFTQSLKTRNLPSIAQAKVYNLKLMKNYFSTIWKYEGTFLKYFKNKKAMGIYNESIDTLDRIDGLMNNEALKLIKDAQARLTRK